MSDDEKKGGETLLFRDRVAERYLQAGRICLIVYGRRYRQLVCVVDFIDRNRVLVDGAGGVLSKIRRISMPIRWLQATKFRLNIPRDVPCDELKRVAQKSGVKKEWMEKTPQGRRNVCIQRREKMNDFDRFKLYYIKGQFKKQVAKELLKLRAEHMYKKPVPVKVVKARDNARLNRNPVLRRVVGKFERKLGARLAIKQMKRKHRDEKYGKFFSRRVRVEASKKRKAQLAAQKKGGKGKKKKGGKRRVVRKN